LMLANGGQTSPRWVRVLTGLVGLLALFSAAFDPFLAVLGWGLVIGIWLLTSPSKTATATTAVLRTS